VALIPDAWLVSSAVVVEDTSEPTKERAPVAAKAEASEEKCDHCDNCDGKEAAVEDDRVETIAVSASPSRGSASAPVTIVVFSDFQCPFCSRAENTVRDLEAAYPGKTTSTRGTRRRGGRRPSSTGRAG
jgi:hypothetical protein